ncbi:PREDICTED: aurora kinase A and ninein-interacting protein, partial [Tauraco erythrolophus]|uniref:aurora kinase A and ninein-interacting protein n=1 Tax=Tauraco erythrolophus TaxID=121530 RepID=UPI000523A9BB
PLTAKPKASSRTLERKRSSVAFTQTRASQPRTRQTTISAFFSTQTDEKDKENSRPSPFIPNKDCKEKGISLAASPVKILALPRTEEAQKQSFSAEERVQVPAQRRPQKAPASPTPLLDAPLLHVESPSKNEASCGVGEDCCCFSFTQDSEGNRIIAHRNQSRLFAGEAVSASGSVTSDCGMEQQAEHQSCYNERQHLDCWLLSISTPTGRSTAPARAPSSHNAGAGAGEEGRGSEPGLSSPCRQLFTQDSEGNRVIAHRHQQVPSPRKDHGCSRRPLPNSPYKGCSRDAANSSWSKLGQQQLEVCYDSLFTQDSEGNRVIKHW